MTQLTFFGGINEIGGNKILLEESGTRVFLDFGKSFGLWGKFFEEFLRPSASQGISQFLNTKLIPDIKGIYRKDLLEFADLPIHKQPYVHGVFLSHAHQDHASYISFFDEEIPIYCSSTTKKVLEAIETVGNRNIEGEITNFKKRPLLASQRLQLPISRQIFTEKKVIIDGIEMELVAVDHSIPGSCAMIIHCPNSTIIYSGDLRLHGTFGNATEEFAQRAFDEKPDVFLCEGTRITETSRYGEEKVFEEAKDVCLKTKGLVTVEFSWKDITRFLTIYKVAKETNRRVLIPIRLAYYINCLRQTLDFLPSLNDENILIFLERISSGTYDDTDYSKWQREFLNYPNLVKADYVKINQNKIISCLGYFDMLDLLEIKPEKNSAYIHATSEPYSEEMEFDAKRMDNWLELLELNKFQIHASGHAPGVDLFKIANIINPKKLIPIHTVHPREFEKTDLKVLYPTIGETIIID